MIVELVIQGHSPKYDDTVRLLIQQFVDALPSKIPSLEIDYAEHDTPKVRQQDKTPANEKRQLARSTRKNST